MQPVTRLLSALVSALSYLLWMGNLPATAQPQDWQWATAIQAADGTTATKTAMDGAGNVYLMGEYAENAYIDTTHLVGGSTYLAKLNALGQWQWAVSVGGRHVTFGEGLSIGPNGTVVVAGWLMDSAQFGSTVVAGFASYVACISPSGQWLWARGLGRAYARATALTATATSIWVAGEFSDSLTVGASHLVGGVPGRPDGFVAQLSPSGQWQQAWGTTTQTSSASLRVNAIAADTSDNVYITGRFAETVQFGPVTLVTPPRSFNRPKCGFVAGISATTGWRWARQWGTLGESEGYGIALDFLSQDPLIAVSYGGSPLLLDTISIVTVPQGGGMVAKLDHTTGQWLWARQTNRRGLSGPVPDDIATDSAGAVYICGKWGSTINSVYLDSIILPNITPVFVAVAEAATGRWRQAWRPNGTNGRVSCIAAGANQQVVIGGQVEGQQPLVFAVWPVSSPGAYQSAYAARLATLPVGVAEPTGGVASGLRVWPNPATPTQVRVAPAAPAPTARTVELWDALGRVVSRTLLPAGQTEVTLPLHGRAAGLYVVRMGAAHRRVLIE